MIFTVIIPTLNPKENLENLLESIARINNVSKRIQVICVNNKEKFSNYISETKWCSKFLDFKYLTTKVNNANIARNLGIRFSSGDVIVFIDDDCIIKDRNFFDKLQYSYIHSNREEQGIGGVYEIDDSETELSKTYFHISQEWLKSVRDNKTNKTDHLIGGNCSYSISIFKKGFSFDSRLRYGGTETTLNLALKKFNINLYLQDNICVLHKIKMSLYSFCKKAYLQGSGKSKNEKTFGKVENNAKYNLKENIYLELYNNFFKLGYQLNSEDNSSRLDQRIKNYIQKFTSDFILLIKTIYLFMVFKPLCYIYYHLFYPIISKIYHMTIYHWNTYILPILKYCKKRKSK